MQCLSAKYNVKVIYIDVKNYNVRIDRNLKSSNDKHQIYLLSDLTKFNVSV